MMKKFVVKITIFITAVVLVFLGLLLLLPVTSRAKQSFIFSEIKKDSLLIHVESPRIIFVGGSNLSFGLNSAILKDSLNLNPINTGVGIGLSLKYMLDHTLQYVRGGDIVVLSPEYQHFFRDVDYGSKVMLGIVLDVNRSNIRLLNMKQIINSVRSCGEFIFSKLNPMDYINDNAGYDIYGTGVYNQFGDASSHWLMERREGTPFKVINPETYNPKVVEALQEYEQIIRNKKAILLVTYPGVQDISFYRSQEAIEKVKKGLIASDLKILGTAERYLMPDSLLFEAPYHLNKQGVDYKTRLLIEDIKSWMSGNN